MALLIILMSCIMAAAVSLAARNRVTIEFVSIGAGIVSLAASFSIAFTAASSGGYAPFPLFSINALGAVIQLIVACIGLATTVYSVPCLRRETEKNIIGFSRVRQYFILLNLFLAALFFGVAVSSPILAWISVEATTLSTAFLVSFYNKPSSIEAAWKYVIINSVGLLLGFLGTILFFTAVGTNITEAISWASLAANVAHLDPLIVKIAFIFVVIGYGTKAGFAPMHTWKPDAYSKAPAPIGAMLSGAVLPVAFSLILRFKKITDLAIDPLFTRQILIAFGIFSMFIAAVIMFNAKNYKRLLAYSSIENAGIMALGFGFGGVGIFAAILHMMYHSLVKVITFFSAGNLVLAYHSARINNVKGALNVVPVTSALFIAGFLIVTGLPPFGIFLTKLLILSAGIRAYPVATVFALLCMTLVFLGFLKHITAMFFGNTSGGIQPGEGNRWLVIPSIVMLAIIAYLSVAMPPFLYTLISESSRLY